MSVAVVGAGVAGIGCAKVLKQYGYEVVVYEKSSEIGGVWNTGYPLIPIQSFDFQYRFTDFECPFKVSEHPTGEQVLKYLRLAAAYYQLDIRTSHSVISTREETNGWILCYEDDKGEYAERFFDYIVACTGLFTKGMYYPSLPGRDAFKGEVHLGPFLQNINELENKRVAVIGYGKSAMDLVALSAERTAQTIHLFRSPRWALTEKLWWGDWTYPLFCRLGTLMITCWVQPNKTAKFIHRFKAFVHFYWNLVSWILKFQVMRYVRKHNKGQRVEELVKRTFPDTPLFVHRPAIIPFNPKLYYDNILNGRILPVRGDFSGFYSDGIVLESGEQVPCDIAVLSLGIQTPDFRFLPLKYRCMLEKEGGAQLYRHLYHPRIPRMAFIGLNQSLLFMPSVEISTLWMVAVWKGEMVLPSVEKMEQCTRRVESWKKLNQAFDPTISYVTHARYQQFIDTLLSDLGISPYRKFPNMLAELFGSYGAADYSRVFAEYDRALLTRTTPLKPHADLDC